VTTIDDPARLDDFPSSPAGFPIFDGHNDTLLALDLDPRRPASLLERGTSGHLDLPRAREGGFAGGMFAVFVPSGRRIRPPRGGVPDRYELPMPRPPGLVRAQRVPAGSRQPCSVPSASPAGGSRWSALRAS
jgi:membrane dipeptidase